MSMIGNLLRVTNIELENYIERSSLLEERIYSEDAIDPNLLDLDKAWEGIFYVLNGFDFQNLDESKYPLIWPFITGNCYGPAYYLSIEEVKQITIVLNEISSEEFHKRFISSNMEKEVGIYSECDYLLETFINMKHFFVKASNEGQAILSFIN